MEVIGPVKIDKLNLYSLPIGHNKSAWDAHGEEVKKIASDFSLVIPEYYPPEYTDLSNTNNPVIALAMQIYREKNFLFEKMSEHFQQENTDVWVLDPAHDFSFAVLRQLIHGVDASGLAILGMSYLELSNKWTQLCNPALKFSRRQILLGGTAFTLAASTTGTALGMASPSSIILEDDLRAVVVAEGLTQMPNYLLTETDALLIYPERHLMDIHGYLENSQRRQDALGRYQILKYIPLFRSFFHIRRYPNGQVDESAVNPIFEV